MCGSLQKISYPDIICYCSQGKGATQKTFLSVIVESRGLCLRHFHIAAVKVWLKFEIVRRKYVAVIQPVLAEKKIASVPVPRLYGPDL